MLQTLRFVRKHANAPVEGGSAACFVETRIFGKLWSRRWSRCGGTFQHSETSTPSNEYETLMRPPRSAHAQVRPRRHPARALLGYQMRLESGTAELVTTKKLRLFAGSFTNCSGFFRAAPTSIYLHEADGVRRSGTSGPTRTSPPSTASAVARLTPPNRQPRRPDGGHNPRPGPIPNSRRDIVCA